MHLKKILAVIVAAALFLCALPIAASAENTPTALYVGESQKAGDNLIQKLETDRLVRVYSVKDSQNYYQLTYEKDVGYVLTFYNAYSMSDVVNKRQLCGLYCDGDLTVRLDISKEFSELYPTGNANISFDLNDSYYDYKENTYINTSGAYGWYVNGTLTVECINERSKTSEARLTVKGDLTKSDDANTGIYCKTLLMNNVTLFADGGNIGVNGGQSVAMIGAKLYANTDPRLSRGSERLFNYSIRTENLIEVYSKVAARGKLDIDAYFGDHEDNRELEEDPVVYARTYDFLNDFYSGNWGTSFDLYYNIDVLPACLHLTVPTGTANRPFSSKTYSFSWLSVSGNRATIRRPTPSTGIVLRLDLKCGQATYLVDTMTVYGAVRWWQVIPYFLSMNWLS